MVSEAIKETKALGLLDGYFNLLSEAGYARRGNVNKFLVYMFLLDFVDVMYPFLTDGDYNKIDALLRKLMNGNSCLLPYDLYCKYKTHTEYPINRIFEGLEGLPLSMGEIDYGNV